MFLIVVALHSDRCYSFWMSHGSYRRRHWLSIDPVHREYLHCWSFYWTYFNQSSIISYPMCILCVLRLRLYIQPLSDISIMSMLLCMCSWSERIVLLILIPEFLIYCSIAHIYFWYNSFTLHNYTICSCARGANALPARDIFSIICDISIPAYLIAVHVWWLIVSWVAVSQIGGHVSRYRWPSSQRTDSRTCIAGRDRVVHSLNCQFVSLKSKEMYSIQYWHWTCCLTEVCLHDEHLNWNNSFD